MNHKIDFSISNPLHIITPSMGAGNMPDFEALKECFEKLGVSMINPNLSEPNGATDIPWGNVGIVDLSNMRGCLTSFDKYLGILDRVQDKLNQNQTHGQMFPRMIPEYENIMWVSSKAHYLSYLDDQNIPIIPTLPLCAMKDPDKANIISQPDNLDNIMDAMRQHMHDSRKNKFVLKPSTSSLARGLIFIESNSSDTYDIMIPSEDQKHTTMSFSSFNDLKERYLTSYLHNNLSNDYHFLFQDYIENIETSAVFVNGQPHFVERAQGETSHIAHARFGGTDTILDNPDPELIRFAFEVMKSLPEHMQSSPFLRIDVMQNLETNEFVLGELEGAGATRLWLKESGRVEEFARMMLQCGVRYDYDNDLKNNAHTL